MPLQAKPKWRSKKEEEQVRLELEEQNPAKRRKGEEKATMNVAEAREEEKQVGLHLEQELFGSGEEESAEEPYYCEETDEEKERRCINECIEEQRDREDQEESEEWQECRTGFCCHKCSKFSSRNSKILGL